MDPEARAPDLPAGFYGRRYFVGPAKDVDRDSGYRDYRRASVRLRQGLLALALAARFGFDRVLDVGSAFGYFVAAARLLGKTASGVERSAFAAGGSVAGARGRVARGDVRALPVAARCADLVVCQEVLEHLPPGAVAPALRELGRAARGLLFLTVPLAPRAGGLVPADRLPRDRAGRPHHGHLTVADRAWWEAAVARGLPGFEPVALAPGFAPRPDQGVFALARTAGAAAPPSRAGALFAGWLMRSLWG